ncbi:MAG TPA: guanylate kinase [Solirubrobacteraceae bacterium]|nr:guanylate kinase [Solirubrobacteraceae bacterium]
MAKVFVITGPSGVGKGTLIRGLLERIPELKLSVSATTRPPRAGERQGIDYHFLSDAEFDRLLGAGAFVEHATYSGNRYGTLRSELEQWLERGVPVVLEIEVQGARQVKDRMPDAETIFIAPPSEEALRARLVGRGTDAAAEVEERMRTAAGELSSRAEFGRTVVNDRLEEAINRLEQIVRSALAGERVDAKLFSPTHEECERP